jgi:hypothetical protein
MIAEYDLNAMKRKGHPFRDKVSKGDIKLNNPLDIPDRESKLAKLTPDEREFVMGLLETYYVAAGREQASS